MYEIIDRFFMLKSLLPKEVAVNFTFDDVRLKSILTNNKPFKFTKKLFKKNFLGFTQYHSGELGDIPGFIQLMPGTCQSRKPINIIGIDKVHLKCDCIQGCIVNGVREPILHSFAMSSKPGHKLCKQPRIKLFNKKKSVLSHIRFYIEGDDHKPVDSNNETISFTCQIIKI